VIGVLKQTHMVVVAFALILCIGYMAYAFVGVGEFLQIFLPYERIKDLFPFSVMEKEHFDPSFPEYNVALQVSKHNTAQFYGILICLYSYAVQYRRRYAWYRPC
jgi:hypothetical protein